MLIKAVTVEDIGTADLITAFLIFHQSIQCHHFVGRPGSTERQLRWHEVETLPNPGDQSTTREATQQFTLLVRVQTEDRTHEVPRTYNTQFAHLDIGEELRFEVAECPFHESIVLLA